ncbi:MAG: acyl-CoA dehydrogenase [Frankiales bacterium]|nr:acyl-CoA dehydrogenase [Frankiales bacterium]
MTSTDEDLAALEAAVRDVLDDHCTPARLAAAEGSTDLRLWDVLHDNGLTLVGVPEEVGGSGGSLRDAATVLRVAGEYAAPVPLAESSLLAGWLLGVAGTPLPAGPVTTGHGEVTASRAEGGWRLDGVLSRVAGARTAESLVLLARDADGGEHVGLLPVRQARLVEGHDLNGQGRDDVLVAVVVADLVPVPAGTARELRLRGALSRALLIAGALDRALALTLRYAGERKQFGRSIGAFQAVQQSVALLAAETAAARAAVDGAVRELGADPASSGAALAVAAAKVRTAQAASVGATVAHQVHGALGMTREHALRFSTTLLWSCRSEWGSEATWSEELADLAMAAGAEGTWPLLVPA